MDPPKKQSGAWQDGALGHEIPGSKARLRGVLRLGSFPHFLPHSLFEKFHEELIQIFLFLIILVKESHPFILIKGKAEGTR